MDVHLLWFKCKNPDCGYIPVKNKKEKIKRYWKHGISLQSGARQRLFMKYAEGTYHRMDNGDVTAFECKYGTIIIYDEYDRQQTNGFHYPIENAEMCRICLQKIKNEGALFQ